MKPHRPVKPGKSLDRWRQENLGRLLVRAFQIFETDMLTGLEDSGIQGLRMSHFVVLRNTDVVGSSLTVIARRAGLTKQAIGPLVHELVDAGVLEMTPDPHDGRAWLVRFTPAGVAGLQTARRVYNRLLARYADRIGEREMRQLLAHLVTFVATTDTAEREA